MTTRCNRCNRKLTSEPSYFGGAAFGPVCARAMFGAKPKRIAREDRRSADDRQLVFEWASFVGTTYGVTA